MRSSLLALLSLPLLATLTARALAQPAAPAPQPVAPTNLPPPSAPVAPPVIDDPLLAPPPAAPRVLSSWEEALEMVRAHSPDYRSTYDSVLRAQAQSRVALAAVLPTITGQGTYTHEFFTSPLVIAPNTPPIAYPPADTFGATGTLTWSVLDARAIHAIGTAKESVAAAQADLADKRRTIAQAIVSTMLGTLAAERVAELNRVGLRAALERLSLAQAKTHFGGGTELDVDRASQDVAAARAAVITGDEALRQAREALGLALGSRTPIAAPGDLDLDRFERTVASTCRLNGDLEQRADVVAARKRVEVAERSVDDVKLQYAPSLVLESQIAWTNQPLYPPETTWALEGLLNVPIWGGARYGLMRDARAAHDQAQQALTDLRLKELVQVEQASRAVEVARASRDVAQEQRDLAARVDMRTRAGYQHGLGTSLDLVVSAQSLRQADINLVLLQFQAAEARALAVLSNAECVF
jgi:outer membrane protein, multidrug efflux system